jgi:hypothetical protein
MEPGWYWRYERWEATPVLRERMENTEDRHGGSALRSGLKVPLAG